MGTTAIIATMGAASVACMAVEKIAYECGKQNIAQYVSLFTSATLGLTALTSAFKLIDFIKNV